MVEDCCKLYKEKVGGGGCSMMVDDLSSLNLNLTHFENEM